MNKYIKVATLLLFGFYTTSSLAQQVSSKPMSILIPKKQEESIKTDIASKEKIMQQDVDDIIEKLRTAKELSKNVQTNVGVRVQSDTINGKVETNLHAQYDYEIVGKEMKSQIDDYPAGKYKLASSNAAKTTVQVLKTTIEKNMSEFFVDGARVTIKITGSADASPIKKKMAYTVDGDFREFDSETYIKNGKVEGITITKESGITENEQLAYLRTYGVRRFLETYVEPLKKTKNSFEHFVEISEVKGGQHRRVSIEIIIHDAFKNYKPVQGTAAGNGTGTDKGKDKEPVIQKSDVDINIPQNNIVKDKTYALIIGNEDYSSFQSGLGSEINVDFAASDAKIFKEYCQKTLGIPEKNIYLKTNATLGQMKQSIMKLVTISEIMAGEAELIFYYSGHGLPEEKTKEGYIMPVDVVGTDVKSAIKIDDLYKQLSEFPTKRVTVFLDACFSGGGRNKSLVELRGVKVKPKDEILKGNLVVFTSSSGDESSAAYKEKQHGLFTYFMLKKLQESKGDISYKEMFDYLTKNVKLESVKVNNKNQTPQVLGSPSVSDTWQAWKMK